jgi:hypothetical protein
MQGFELSWPQPQSNTWKTSRGPVSQVQPAIWTLCTLAHSDTRTLAHARKLHPPPFRTFRGPSVLARSVGRAVPCPTPTPRQDSAVPSRHHQHQQDFFLRAIGADQVLAAYPLPIYYIICPHRHAPSLKLRACSACGLRLEPSQHTLFHLRPLPVPQASNPASREIHAHGAIALCCP